MSRLPGLPIAGPVSNSALRGRLSLVQHDLRAGAGRVRREKGEISAGLPSPRSAGNVKRPCHHQRSLYFRRSRPFPSGACLAGGTNQSASSRDIALPITAAVFDRELSATVQPSSSRRMSECWAADVAPVIAAQVYARDPRRSLLGTVSRVLRVVPKARPRQPASSAPLRHRSHTSEIDPASSTIGLKRTLHRGHLRTV